jgi:DNA gyrase/topoisomerase IV subunit A
MEAGGSSEERRLGDRVRILAAMVQALEDRVGVLQLVAEADDVDGARDVLMAAYGWDKVETSAVLDLQLHRASRSARARIAEELHETRERLRALQ